MSFTWTANKSVNSFLPTNIAPCSLWLDGADPLNNGAPPASGGLSTWFDRSGNGNNLAQGSTSLQPSYSPTNQSCTFDGTADYMYSTISPQLTVANGFTIFVVSTQSGLTGDAYQRLLSVNEDLYPDGILWGGLNGNLTIDNGAAGVWNNGASAISPTVSALQKLVVGCTFATGGMIPYVSGTQYTTRTATPSQPINQLYLGCAYYSATPRQYWPGQVFEIIYFASVLSSTQRQVIEGYLSWKWSLQANLPSNHPYKSNPPFQNNPSIPVSLTTVQTTLITNKSSAYQPTALGGCTIWLDAADPNGDGTIPTNGSAVSTWVDKSGNGMTVSAASSQPTYTRNAQNGLGALTFDGTKNLGTASVLGSKFAGNTNNFTVYVVYSLNNTSGAYASPFCWANGPGYPRIALTVGNNADGVMMDVGTTGSGRTSSSVPPPTFDNTFYFTSYLKNGANTQLNLNGSNKASSSTQDTTGFASSNYSFNVGNGYSNTTFFMRGNVGEIIFYNSTLPTSNFQQVEGYLAWKWGLQTQLPSTHPYRSYPPFQNNIPLPTPINFPQRTIASPFSPLTLTGCILWLDAADSSSVVRTGTTITQWNDKSGGGFNATSTGSPQYILQGQNKLNTIVLNGTSQYFTLTATVNSATHTFVAVHRPNNTTTANTSLFRYQTTNVNYIVFPYNGSGVNKGYITSYDGTALSFLNSTLVEGSQSTSFNLIMATIQSGNQVVYRNGTQQASASEVLSSSTSPSLTIGTYLSSEYYGGTLCEMLVYSTFLSASDRQELEGYLAWKWGIQGSLPSGHPYKVFPPPP